MSTDRSERMDFDVPEPIEERNRRKPIGQIVNHAIALKKWRQRVQKLEKRESDVGHNEGPRSRGLEIPELTQEPSPKPVFERPDLSSGVVLFRDVHKNDLEGQPYLCVSHDSAMSEVVSILEHEWKMPIPTIVLEILSGVKEEVSFSSERQWENLKQGFALAANKTNMWIVTHGLNVGIGKAIGEIFRDEKQRRQTMTCSRHPHQGAKLPKLTVLGVVREENLRYANSLDGKSFITEVSSEGNDPKQGKYELNPHHSHFMIVRDGTPKKKGILQFLISFGNYLKNPPRDSLSVVTQITQPSANRKISYLADTKVPMIALVIGGGFSTTVMISEYLRNKIPVVVVKGSGGAADLLSFAYEEIKEKTRVAWDPDYVENFVMSEVSKKIAIHFEKYRENNIARNKFRDKILDCIRLSHQDERVFFNIIDIHNTKSDLSLLNEHLLQAVFNAEHREGSDSQWKYCIQKDVFLALDWNCPHICQSGVFKRGSLKYKIESPIFEHALLREDRETFVELFLDHGFQLYPYLTGRRFCRLCERADNSEFFRSFVLENALCYLVSRLDELTFLSDLNWLIFRLTKVKNFICLKDPASDSNHVVCLDDRYYVRERRALNALVVWAVLMNRPKLAKILWKKADYPIHLALLVSMLYNNIICYVSEKHIIKQLEDLSRDFVDMAVGVLDLSFQAGNCRAYDSLSEEVSDFNFKTAVEMAAVAGSRQFISHPCCQKWLTSMFYGDIRVRDLKYGFATFPTWIKIVSSAFLLFPINAWIMFRPGRGQINIAYEEMIQESELESEMGSFSRSAFERKCTIDGIHTTVPLNLVEVLRQQQEGPDPRANAGVRTARSTDRRRDARLPFWRKVATVWDAPVAKFWTHQIFYIMYLTLFGMTVLWPSCGNFGLDVCLWFWTMLLLLENIRITYIHHMKYSSINVGYGLVEIGFMAVFLVTFLFVRILPADCSRRLHIYVPRAVLQGYGARVIMCLGLLYFFYRFIWIYFPISPTLGRLLFRIRLMITRDFMHFLRLVLLFVVSSGIAIHSVIYPDYPMSWELIRRVFHKAWFSLFLTPIEDLEEKPCSAERYQGSDTCRIGPYANVACPVTGPWPYILTIQYFIILKLVLITLLFALFSDTASKHAGDADAIWRFQRYHLVLDFLARPRLPAPLNVFSFIIMLFEAIRKCSKCNYNIFKRKHSGSQKSEDSSDFDENASEDFYWRSLASEHLLKERQKQENATLAMRQMDNITSIAEILEYQKVLLQSLKVRISELETMMMTSRISLEEITHVINKDDERFSVTKVHLLSRQSPYPETRVKRFPLANKYVPWEVLYSVYDPVVYTKPRNRFPPDLINFVDEDLLQMRESPSRTGRPAPRLMWNIASTGGASVYADRSSWIKNEDGQEVFYKLDSTGLPMNPMGRTGLRGRGLLCRWGPNHAIRIIVTRWKNTESFPHLPSTQPVRLGIAAEDQRALEAVVMKVPKESHFCLPGGFSHGEEKIYDIVRRIFSLEQTPGAPISNWDSDSDMHDFFAEFARVPTGDFVDIVGPSEKCEMEHCMILRGYVDDTRNTDNAWMEAEVWHFHYTSDKCVDLSPHHECLRWKKVSRKLEAKMIPSHAMLLKEIQQKLESCS